LQIRPYEEADRPFLRTLYLASRKDTWTWMDTRDFQLEDFDRAIIGETVIVAEHQGKLLGFASIFTQENFLHNLFVDPAHKGTGVGSALLHASEAMFTGTGRGVAKRNCLRIVSVGKSVYAYTCLNLA